MRYLDSSRQSSACAFRSGALILVQLLLLGSSLAAQQLTPKVSSGAYSNVNHALALTPAGQVKAWGVGLNGQLGMGNQLPLAVPTLVPGIANARDVAAGYRFSLALLADGTVKGWGYNAAKQLGLGVGSPTQVTSPTLIPGLVGVTAIAAGTDFGIALLADGTVKGWGANSNGSTGTNLQVTTVASPTHVVVGGVSGGSLNGVVAIAAGGGHALALRSDGTVFAWGADTSGQIGFPGSVGGAVPLAIQMPTVSGAVAIAAGLSHSLIVLANGNVLACGDDTYGQLGTGSGAAVNQTPVPVLSLTGSPLIGITAASAGGRHSLFLDSAGDVYGCGSNTGWRLGLSTEQNYTSARYIPGAQGSVSMTAGNLCSWVLDWWGNAYACGAGLTLGISSSATLAQSLQTMPQLATTCGNNYVFGLTSVGDGLQMQIACNQTTNGFFGVPLFYANVFSMDAVNSGTQSGQGNWFGLHVSQAALDAHVGLALAEFDMVLGMLNTAGAATAAMPMNPALNGITIYGVSIAISPLPNTVVAESNIAEAVL